ELSGWYTPGTEAITFDIDGYIFGCAICIESQFPEVFIEYEKLGVDAILFSSYGLPEYFQVALRAHAGLNCIWISSATPAQEASKGPAHVIGPDGNWIDQCPKTHENSFVLANLNRDDPAYHVPIKLARLSYSPSAGQDLA
ncbi:MAG TPA: carbon-nitrogen hydrolase family protein, partial [Candidatus Tectomicrobia bacterium]